MSGVSLYSTYARLFMPADPNLSGVAFFFFYTRGRNTSFDLVSWAGGGVEETGLVVWWCIGVYGGV